MQIEPIVRIFETDWARPVADAIQAVIEDTIVLRRKCSLMLTGGTTVQEIYRRWAARPDFPHTQIAYYFGDERCVPADHPDSNYGMACQSLFPGGVPQYVCIHPMEGDSLDCEAAARRYEALLPDHIDVLLLGVGEDGHIASLFQGGPATEEMSRKVMPVIGPKPPPRRLTVTPKVIAEAGVVFLLATGRQKGKILARVLNDAGPLQELPVRNALRATWLLDQAAGQELVRDHA